MSTPAPDRPALLGGQPLRPQGPPPWPVDDGEVADILRELAASRDWGRYHGPWCDRLIATLQSLTGSEHVLLCSSGTAAVELALRGVQVSPGDEVLLAAYDFKANFTNVLTLGATPVLVDVRADDCQLDISQLDAARTPRTKAVLASHLHGGLVDMPALRDWADRHGLALIEDACQAHGATIHGRPAGRWGHVAVLSFGGSKLLSAGRGGAVLTSDPAIAQRIRLYTQRGNDAYPLSELQAAVLLPQLDRLPERHQRRAHAAARLRELLHGTPGLTFFPSPRADCDPAYYKLALLYDPAPFDNLPRDRFAEALRAEGIPLDPGFRSLHRTHARSRFRASAPLPHADRADESLLQLHHPFLLADDDELHAFVAAVSRTHLFARELAIPSGGRSPAS
jgi:perosamine synthetase